MYRIIEALTKSDDEPFYHKVIVDDNDNFVLKTYDTVTVNICLEALERAANKGAQPLQPPTEQSTPIITTGCRGCINRGTVCDSCEDFSYLEVT